MRRWWYVTGHPNGPIGPFFADNDVAFATWNPLTVGQKAVHLWYFDRGEWLQAG